VWMTNPKTDTDSDQARAHRALRPRRVVEMLSTAATGPDETVDVSATADARMQAMLDAFRRERRRQAETSPTERVIEDIIDASGPRTLSADLPGPDQP
jgi:hypothetical protein